MGGGAALVVRTRRGGPQPAPEARLPVRPRRRVSPPARTGSPGARTRASRAARVRLGRRGLERRDRDEGDGDEGDDEEARRDSGRGGGARGAPRETRGVGGGRHHRNDSRRRRRRRHRWFAEGRDGTAPVRGWTRRVGFRARWRVVVGGCTRSRRRSGRGDVERVDRREGAWRAGRRAATFGAAVAVAVLRARRAVVRASRVALVRVAVAVAARHLRGAPTGPARLEPFATDGYDTPAWVKAATMRHRAVSDSESDEDDVPSASRFASRASTTEPEAAIPATKGVKDTPAVVRNSRASVAGTVAASVGGSTDGELDALRARLESAASERASKVADAAAPKGTAAEPLVGDDFRSFGSLVRARAAMFGGVR